MALINKNISPSKLAFINAIILSVIIGVLILLFKNNLIEVLASMLIVFIISYFLIKKTIEVFIYRKFKLIYKFIYDTKATKKEEFFYQNVVPQKSIEEVSNDVLRWGKAKRQEIAILKQNEQFRKDFLMNLAHELKTPIFTTQGYIDTLLSGGIHDPNINEKFLRNATKGIDRLVQLTKDLDEISKLESGEYPLNYSDFKIMDLVNEVYDELHLKAKEKNINLTYKKDSLTNIVVHADIAKIRQVLINLVENAVKYSHKEGDVTIGIYNMDDEKVLIEVSDEGPGIATEHLNRIFERFYRADRARSRDIGGTGLGLAIVKHIVEAHQQTITVRSKENVGSSFGFTLNKPKEQINKFPKAPMPFLGI